MKRTQDSIAEKLELSSSFFSQLLSGARNVATITEAERIKAILKHKGPFTIWLRGGGTTDERRTACGLEPKSTCRNESRIKQLCP